CSRSAVFPAMVGGDYADFDYW
nr:immunoglobulin heavy chain junction region [Macaca mulatta]